MSHGSGSRKINSSKFNTGAIRRFIDALSSNRDVDSHDLRTVLDSVQEGVALYSDKGELLFANKCIQGIELPEGIRLKEAYMRSVTGTLRIPINLTESVSLHVVNTKYGFGLFTEPPMDRLSQRDKALRYLMQPLQDQETIYSRAARALGLSSQWQWVGVSRFLDKHGEKVCFEGWWDSAALKIPFDQETANSACEVVANTETFCFYSGKDNLKQRFPEWGMVDALDLHAYAGLVIRRGAIAVGHIMLMHNEPKHESDLVEDLIRLAAEFVSVQIELDHQSKSAESHYQEARVDSLTGLGNRLSYDETLSGLSDKYQRDAIKDAAVINVDLNGLKNINDTLGHEAGDQLLCSYADILRKLWRPTDPMYRQGGDEFTLLIPDVVPAQIDFIVDRMQQSSDQLDGSVEYNSGASFGICFFSETDGNTQTAVVLADERMYEHKKASCSQREAA